MIPLKTTREWKDSAKSTSGCVQVLKLDHSWPESPANKSHYPVRAWPDSRLVLMSQNTAKATIDPTRLDDIIIRSTRNQELKRLPKESITFMRIQNLTSDFLNLPHDPWSVSGGTTCPQNLHKGSLTFFNSQHLAPHISFSHEWLNTFNSGLYSWHKGWIEKDFIFSCGQLVTSTWFWMIGAEFIWFGSKDATHSSAALWVFFPAVLPLFPFFSSIMMQSEQKPFRMCESWTSNLDHCVMKIKGAWNRSHVQSDVQGL